MCKEMQQCANKGSEEEHCYPVNVDVNNACFNLKKPHLALFYEEGNRLDVFVRPKGFTLCFGEKH